MARLKVFLNGQLTSQHDLTEAHELMVGRGETCDVQLAPERGISRQHFRIRYAEGQWIVEVLSRYGELYKNGERQSIFAARDGTTFTVPPYEFVFENESEAVNVHGMQPDMDMDSQGHEEDRTHIGYLPSNAYLRLVDHQGRALQNFKLEGQAWIGGRDTTCSIYIDNPLIGRKQFEVQKQDDAYYVRDLGSINVTLHNGRPLAIEDWTPLQSSDVISVADWSLHFELRDAGYEQRLQEVDPALMLPMNYDDEVAGAGSAARDAFASKTNMGSSPAQGFAGFDANGVPIASPTVKPGMKLFGKQISGLTPARLAMVVVLLLAGLYGMFGQDEDKHVIAKLQTPFDKLGPDKQQVVKQLYLTAQSLIAQGRYELARQEIIKLHQIIPYYEDSKQIEETANQGLAILAEREKNEAVERQRAQIEEKIQRQVADCRAALNENSDSLWLDGCLASVMEFNPEHPSIVALRNEVDRLTRDRAMALANQKDYEAKVAAHRAVFARAQKVEKQGLPIPAIAAYQKVLKTGLPDPGNLNRVARRQIASLQSGMEALQAEAEKNAEVAYRSGALKKAIEILREGIKINPDNEMLKSRHAQMMNELRKQMMNFYQEGILEESVGEVETAKNKWRKIMDQSLPGEDYFEKAKMKLKKYGPL
jgi:pSer/pThr/pTyr-binding forkhead associated (FHA) protein/tetratricopeptide (TPR) repeat protein